MEAKQIIKNYASLKADRAKMESRWDTLHDYFMPATDEIQRQTDNSGDLYRRGQHTDEAILALRVLVSGFHSYLTSPASDWFGLRVKDDKQNTDEVKRFLQDVEDVLRESINGTNFNTQQDGFYSSSACYGTSVMYIEEDEEDDLRFYNIPIKNIYLEEDSKERVTSFYIKYKYTASQAIDRFGETAVSENIRRVYKADPACQEKYVFIMYVGKRHVRDESKKDALNMPYMVKWIEEVGEYQVSESGLMSMPFAYHRWTKRAETPYGYSPCMEVLMSTMKLNEIVRLSDRGLAKSIDAPIMLPSKGYVNKVNLNPGAIMYKKQGVTGDVELFPSQTSPGAADYMINYRTDLVRRGLYNDVINALGGITKRMNDTEVQEIIAEKMSQLGPAVGRFIDEFLNNLIARSLDILARRGKLPEAPESLGDNWEYKIEYLSPLAKAQRASELTAIQTSMAIGGQLAQFDPTVVDKYDFDKIVDKTVDISGADLDILRPIADVEKIREERAKQQAMAMQQAQEQAQLQKAQQVQEIENNGQTE